MVFIFRSHDWCIGQVEQLKVFAMVGLDVVEEGLVVGDFVDVEDADAGEEVLGFGWHFFFNIFY